MASKSERSRSRDALAYSALAAPALSLIVCFVAIGLARGGEGWGPLNASMIATSLVLLAVVTAWGFVPAILFGWLMLRLLRRSQWPSSESVFMLAGGTAAALYVLCSIALAFTVVPLAVLLAPWAVFLREQHFFEAWSPISAIIVAGLLAGWIYARISRTR